MAITKYPITNGDLSELAEAMQSIVPSFFASVTYGNGGFICKDADDNTVFSASQSVSAQYWYAMRSASSSVGGSGQLSTTKPLAFYKVGSNGGAIELMNHTLILIGKTKDGKTGIALTSTGIGYVLPACWGDDTSFNAPIQIAPSSNSAVGNHTLFVPIPLYGTYEESNNFTKAFFLPMAQPNMRGVVQQLVEEGKGVYLTDGYVALLDEQ